MAKRQKLVHLHGDTRANLQKALTASSVTMDLGEITVVHGSEAEAALAIKTSDDKLVFFSSSAALDADIKGVQGQIKAEAEARKAADNELQSQIGTGYTADTASTITEDITSLNTRVGKLEGVSGLAETALQSVTGEEGTYTSVEVGAKAAGVQGLKVNLTTQAVQTASSAAKGLAEASDVKTYVDNQDDSVKTDIIGADSDETTDDTIWGAKNYAKGLVDGKNVSATGDTYVHASAANNKVTVETQVSTALTKDTAAGTLADSKAVVDYVGTAKTEIKGITDSLQNQIGNGYTGEGASNITADINSLTGRVQTLESYTAETKSALQYVYASVSGDSKNYVKVADSKDSVSGKVEVGVIVADIDGNGDGLVYASNLRTKLSGMNDKIAANEGAINTLNGDDKTAGSVRYIAKDAASAAVASVVSGAPEAFDTLKEIADWISTASGETAAQILTKVNTNTQNISNLSAATEGLEERIEAAESDIDSLQKTIGGTYDSANTVADAISGHDTRIAELEKLSATTQSAIQKVTASTETTGTLEVTTTKTGNDVSIKVNTVAGSIAENNAGIATGGMVYTAQQTAIEKANEKVETVQFAAVAGDVTMNAYNSGAKVSVGADGDGKAVTLDLSELVIDCGEF